MKTLNDYGCKLLALGILRQAKCDYKKRNGRYTKEIEEFLQSREGEAICELANLNPKYVMRKFQNTTK